jgi:hypothetical protein
LKEFLNYFAIGFKYAVIFWVVAGLMGVIYGLFGLMIWSPAIFSISLVGVFVILNFPFALIAFVINLFFLPFSKSSKVILRYFAYSVSFLVVFGLHFVAFKILDLRPF